MAEKINRINGLVKNFSSEGTVFALGYANGFLWANDYDIERMIEYPFWTTLHGAFGGFLGSAGATLVHRIMPERFAWIPCLLLIGSLGVITTKQVRKITSRRRNKI
ncbi:MAG: hypothetical protein Hyperionvirus3_113 [Hyperionvirus sp.]|uniref:Uncharacterized protein n=1 Tax=Hyperionvirus sp. TaxID=2487770 RepID=A0A3G5A6U8_9VIRU|nr:MAG: hypothetical protein Hyperionvirus3_113 [Hyperionvirus sp.]